MQMSGYISGGLLLDLFHGHLQYMAKGHPPIRRPRRRAPAADIQEPIGHRGHLLPEPGGVGLFPGQITEIHFLLQEIVQVHLQRFGFSLWAVALKPDELLDPGLETLQLQPPLTSRAFPRPKPPSAPFPVRLSLQVSLCGLLGS